MLMGRHAGPCQAARNGNQSVANRFSTVVSRFQPAPAVALLGAHVLTSPGTGWKDCWPQKARTTGCASPSCCLDLCLPGLPSLLNTSRMHTPRRVDQQRLATKDLPSNWNGSVLTMPRLNKYLVPTIARGGTSVLRFATCFPVAISLASGIAFAAAFCITLP